MYGPNSEAVSEHVSMLEASSSDTPGHHKDSDYGNGPRIDSEIFTQAVIVPCTAYGNVNINSLSSRSIHCGTVSEREEL